VTRTELVPIIVGLITFLGVLLTIRANAKGKNADHALAEKAEEYKRLEGQLRLAWEAADRESARATAAQQRADAADQRASDAADTVSALLAVVHDEVARSAAATEIAITRRAIANSTDHP